MGELAKTGYYESTEVSRSFARAALEDLEILCCSEIDEEDRADSERLLTKFLAWLYRKHEKLTGEDLGKKTAELAEK